MLLSGGFGTKSSLLELGDPRSILKIHTVEVHLVTPRFPKYAGAETRHESATYIREEITPHIYAKPKVT